MDMGALSCAEVNTQIAGPPEMQPDLVGTSSHLHLPGNTNVGKGEFRVGFKRRTKCISDTRFRAKKPADTRVVGVACVNRLRAYRIAEFVR